MSLEGGVTRALLEDPNATVHLRDVEGGEIVGNLWSTRENVTDCLGIARDELLGHMLTAMNEPVDTVDVDEPGFAHTVTENVDLTRLPIPKFYPEDGGRYITAGIVISEFRGRRNVSFHRMMVMDSRRLAVRLVPRHTFTLFREAQEAGEDLRVAICIGVCPSVLLAAATSVDYGQDELEIASALREACGQGPLEVGITATGLRVPADADYVLEGRITAETAAEGPFVDITGTYDHVRDQPVIVVDRMYNSEEPVFHAVLPGGLEHYLLMGLPKEPVMFRTVRQAVPRTHAVRLTEGGCCWLHGVVSITKNKEGDSKNAIMAAFTGHPSLKHVVVVDKDIDIFDDREVEWAIATRFQADRDLVVVPGAAGSSLDPSADTVTTKVGLDATKPSGGGLFDRARP